MVSSSPVYPCDVVYKHEQELSVAIQLSLNVVSLIEFPAVDNDTLKSFLVISKVTGIKVLGMKLVEDINSGVTTTTGLFSNKIGNLIVTSGIPIVKLLTMKISFLPDCNIY